MSIPKADRSRDAGLAAIPAGTLAVLYPYVYWSTFPMLHDFLDLLVRRGWNVDLIVHTILTAIHRSPTCPVCVFECATGTCSTASVCGFPPRSATTAAEATAGSWCMFLGPWLASPGGCSDGRGACWAIRRPMTASWQLTRRDLGPRLAWSATLELPSCTGRWRLTSLTAGVRANTGARRLER